MTRNEINVLLAEVAKRLATLVAADHPPLRAAVAELVAATTALKTCAANLDDALQSVGSAYGKFEKLAATMRLLEATKYDA